jgi:hypothetical protein
VRTLPEVNGTSSPIPAYFDVPRSLEATEAFRLRWSKLYRIEMTLTEVPYGMSSVFHEGAPVDLSGPGTNRSVPIPCDQSCLFNVTGQVLRGMLENKISNLPLSHNVHYSENGQPLALRDGLWEILGHYEVPGVDRYAVQFADTDSGTGAYWVLSKSITQQVCLHYGSRSTHKISEIMAFAVRTESSDARGGTMTLMRPLLPVEWQEGDPVGNLSTVFSQDITSGVDIQLDLVDTYFDGLENHSSVGVSLSPDCTRQDNFVVQANFSYASQIDGSGIAPNGLYQQTTRVRNRHILVADGMRGAVIAVAMVDNPSTAQGQATKMTERVPSTYMVCDYICMFYLVLV